MAQSGAPSSSEWERKIQIKINERERKKEATKERKVDEGRSGGQGDERSEVEGYYL